ncbi:MAG: SprT family zinc-dependent metalloprotease [Victivallales bacterium]|nr:SprT family zinc-dependent metalloprotease [Victivallales bacterium]
MTTPELPGVDELVRSPARRTLCIVVNREARVCVRAPADMPLPAIRRFVAERQPWIAQKKAAIRRQLSRIVIRSFTEGENFLFKGQLYPLHFSAAAAAPISFDRAFIIHERYRDKAREMLTGWYEIKAEQLIGERVKLYAEAFGLDYLALRIGDTRSQWGSCSAEGKLSFSWRLIMCPTRIIDYVVAHELAHRRYMNHSAAFWAQVAKMRPDYREQQQWLKDNAPLLRF